MDTSSQEGRKTELRELFEQVVSQRPLFLASNRGPVEHQMNPEGRPEARRGSGSVVTAFSSMIQSAEFTWVASAMGKAIASFPTTALVLASSPRCPAT